MANTIHCDNCGANMNVDPDNPMQFCPYCGAALKRDETIYDYARFKAKHDEQVRQKMVAEKKEDDKRTFKWLMLFIAIPLLALVLLGVFQEVPKASEDSRLNALVEEVQQLIISGDYDEALTKAQGIRVEKDGWFDDRFSKWENQRKDLIKLIEQKQRESN